MAVVKGKFAQLIAPGLHDLIVQYFTSQSAWYLGRNPVPQGRCQVCLNTSIAGQTINGQYFCQNHMPPGTFKCPNCGVFSAGSLGTSFCQKCMATSLGKSRTTGGTVTGTFAGTTTSHNQTATGAATMHQQHAARLKQMLKNSIKISPGAIYPDEDIDYDSIVWPDQASQVAPNDERTAVLTKKIVTPTQAFNEMHMLLSALIKQYGKATQRGGKVFYEIELKGDTIEDASFVAERQRLSCTKDTTSLNYKVYLNFEDE